MNQGLNLFCSVHESQIVEFIDTNPTQGQALKCCSCLIEQKLNQKELVLIDHCLMIQDHDSDKNDQNNNPCFIQNWPPGININLLSKIKNNLQTCQKDTVKQKIQTFFDGFEREISECLQQTKKSIIINIESLDLDYNWARDAYSQIAQKEQLVEILSSNKNNLSQLNIQLLELIQQIKKKSEENMKKVEDLYEDYLKNKNQADFLQSESTKNLILNLIYNIKFIFSPKLIPDMSNTDSQRARNDLNNKKSEFNYDSFLQYFNRVHEHMRIQQVEAQMNLLQFDSRINQVKKEIKNLEEDLFIQENRHNSQQLLNNLSATIDNWFENNEKICSTYVSIEDLKQIQDIILNSAKKMLGLPKQQVEDIYNLIDCFERNNSNPKNNKSYLYLIDLIQSERAYSKLNQQSMVEILNKYPIFLTKPIKQFIPIQLKFNIKLSKNGTIISQNNQITLISNVQEKITFQSEALQVDKKYIVRFKLSSPLSQMNTINIGITSVDNNNINVVQNTYIGDQISNGIDSFKGQYFKNITNKNINEIEMRICIKENIVIFTDYPSYENQNFKSPQSAKFNEQYNHYLYISMTNTWTKSITISNMYEVEEFPQD